MANKKSSQIGSETKGSILSLACRKEMDAWILKFPPGEKRPVVLHALTVVQNENGGWLTNELMDAVADYLELARIEVYEVAAFYTMFELKPVGKYKISLCTNIACMLCNCDGIAEHLRAKLGIDFGETTKDGKITLKQVECLAACGGAPAMQINDIYYENVTPEKIDEILAGLK